MQSVKEWIDYAKQFHGHICPYVTLGVRASIFLLNKMNMHRASPQDTINENLLAIVECNNCFLDGVQIATRCTIGNNSLIYKDIGKNALSIIRRNTFEGFRLYMDADKIKNYFPKRGLELFDKVIRQRRASEQEINELSQIWEKTGYQMFEIDENIFQIKPIKIKPIERAPIFDNIRCDKCQELVMSTKIVKVGEKYYCKQCLNQEYQALVGRGIQLIRFELLEE